MARLLALDDGMPTPDPMKVRVPGRTTACPLCGTSAWYGLRNFPGQAPSYWLCKWCGYRWDVARGQADFTLAIPVVHQCPNGDVVLTWMEFGPTDDYQTHRWTCVCGARLLILVTLRPYPRFAGPTALLGEPPGA